MSQISGINLMTCYMFAIFDLVSVPPAMGSILFAVVGLLGSLLSPFVLRLKSVGVRGGFIMGNFLMFMCLALLGTFAYWKIPQGAFSMVLGFQFIYQMTVGPLYWFHIPEITRDAAFGISIFTVFFLSLIFASTSQLILNSALQVAGTFWMLAIFTFICFVFSVVLIKPTQGLTETEKRTLYYKQTSINKTISKEGLAE